MKNKKKEEKQQRSFFDSKVNVVILCVAAGIILALSFIFMVIESGYGKIQVKNNTDLKLEYVKAYYVNANGPINQGFTTKSIDAGKSYSQKNEVINLTNAQANLEIRFKFKDHDEIFTDAGIFNGKMEGNIKIQFKKTSDPNILILKVKASNGLFNTKLIDCNEKVKIDLSSGEVVE